MLARIIRKFVLALSIAFAIALIVIAVSSRRGDLVIAGARGGTYHELRSDRGHVSYLRISGWTPATQPLTSGRARQAAALESIVLLSGSPIILTPNQGR